MDDLDLYLALSHKEKVAIDLKDLLKKGLEKAQLDTKPRRIGAGVGAGTLALASILASKRFKGNPSLFERATNSLHERHEAKDKRMEETGARKGFSHKTWGLTTQTAKEYARISGEHPIASAVPAALSGKDLGVATADKIMKELARIKGKTASVEVVEGWGRELAQQDLEKTAIIGALGRFAKPMVGKLMQTAVSNPLGARVAGGAALGVAGGAAKHMMKPKDPTTGQRQGSLLGSMATGGVLGAGVGAGANSAARYVGSMNNSVGQFAGKALQNTARTSGNQAAYRAAKDMQKVRVNAQLAQKTTGLGNRARAAAAANPNVASGFKTAPAGVRSSVADPSVVSNFRQQQNSQQAKKDVNAAA